MFEVKGESLPPRQPEWGRPAGMKRKDDCDQWELANGSTAGVDSDGKELWQFVDSMSVVSQNIDAEIAAKKDADDETILRRDRLNSFDVSKAPAEIQDFLKDILVEIKNMGGF